MNIVLVEPQIPQNTGNIARTCAAVGARLHIIRPMGFEIDDTKLKRAGLDYWHMLDITYYDNTDDFFGKNCGDYFFFTTKARSVYSEKTYRGNIYIIFGREDAGLDEGLLKNNPEGCVRIPIANEARSLNLSNCVAIGAFEVLRQWGFNGLKEKGSLTKYEWDSVLN